MPARWEEAKARSYYLTPALLEQQGIAVGFTPDPEDYSGGTLYPYSDVCTATPENSSDFQREHYHEDDEIRVILNGTGTFYVRSADDRRWIIIDVERGDIIGIPAGRYHMFTTTRYTKARRFFKRSPKWAPFYRLNGRKI